MINESVYSLIKDKEQVQGKGTRHKSKHNWNVPPTFSTFGFAGTSKVLGNVEGEAQPSKEAHPSKKGGATMGTLVSGTVSTKQFTKKGTSIVKDIRSDPQDYEHPTFKRAATGPGKQPVPSRDDKPVMGLTTDKNFVVANAVENILAVPRKKPENESRAIDKKNFGRVPKYVENIKTELRDHYEQVEAATAAQVAYERGRLVELSAAEAKELYNGLKVRWDAANKQFQTLGFALETRSQLKRKETLENELKALEDTMKKVGKKHVYVFNDQM